MLLGIGEAVIGVSREAACLTKASQEPQGSGKWLTRLLSKNTPSKCGISTYCRLLVSYLSSPLVFALEEKYLPISADTQE